MAMDYSGHQPNLVYLLKDSQGNKLGSETFTDLDKAKLQARLFSYYIGGDVYIHNSQSNTTEPLVINYTDFPEE